MSVFTVYIKFTIIRELHTRDALGLMIDGVDENKSAKRNNLMLILTNYLNIDRISVWQKKRKGDREREKKKRKLL